MSPDRLAQAIGIPMIRAQYWLPYLMTAMQEFEIDNPARRAMFIAQTAHESGGFRWMQEIWGPTPAQKRYEGRIDLGNTQPGDGARFAGHGPIQITGRYMHERCGKALGLDLIESPLLITLPAHAFRSAGWFWRDEKRLNPLADANTDDAFLIITKRINGGTNGLADRQRLWASCRRFLNQLAIS